ncbi:hypothetical protein LEP1GSC061_0951 [Leptospira wolffii serovar Khorat str. Khorat-H2]|nr:hypothetical protein LEP1GSC061_0951 [Leptospira wolffii serovar Khorat str. Khorat-H2]
MPMYPYIGYNVGASFEVRVQKTDKIFSKLPKNVQKELLF